MIPIFIDTSSISEQFAVDQSQINELMDYTVKEVTARYAEELTNNAIRTLKSARQEYINSIVVVDEGFARGAVMLVGWLPNAIEAGIPGWDMKPDLLSGPNAKTGADGDRYNRIPFTFGTPGALSENFSSILPKEVYNVIKNKPVDKATGTSAPLKLEEIPTKFQEPQKRMIQLPKSKKVVEYQHKGSIYEGMRKVQDKTTKQNRYESFRTVSSKSPEASWQHPGFGDNEAVGLMDKTLQEFDVPANVGEIIDNWLSNL